MVSLLQNFAAQMAGGFDEKSGGAQMGVMQGPMVRKDLLPHHLVLLIHGARIKNDKRGCTVCILLSIFF